MNGNIFPESSRISRRIVARLGTRSRLPPPSFSVALNIWPSSSGGPRVRRGGRHCSDDISATGWPAGCESQLAVTSRLRRQRGTVPERRFSTVPERMDKKRGPAREVLSLLSSDIPRAFALRIPSYYLGYYIGTTSIPRYNPSRRVFAPEKCSGQTFMANCMLRG